MLNSIRNKLRRFFRNRRYARYAKWTVIISVIGLVGWAAYGAGQFDQAAVEVMHQHAPHGKISLPELLITAQQGHAHGTLTLQPKSGAWFKGTLFSPPITARWNIPDFHEDVSNAALKLLSAHGIQIFGNISVLGHSPIPGSSQIAFSSLMSTFGGWIHLAILTGIGLFLFFYLKSVMGSMSVFHKRFQIVHSDKAPTRFSDVIGMEGPKREITEIVDYLRDPLRFSALGARAPKGIILNGPPGNGKTLLAKAVAGEAGVDFFEQNASSFVQLYVGAGAMAVRELFAEARKSGRAVVFIDEIDAVAGNRDGSMGSHDERLQTLNALLSELDGFTDNSGIIVIAATNRLDSLDPAITRPGRFDRKVYVPMPGVEDRANMLSWYLRKVKAGVVDVPRLARLATGFSGADIAQWVNEAAVEAARSGQSSVHMDAFLSSRDRIMVGPRNFGVTLNPEERRVTAYHEAGHAVARLALGGTVDKVSILPRGGALGVTISIPEDRNLHNRHQLEQELVVLCAGRAAEEIVIGAVSNGAANDLQRASEMANMAVQRFGFGSGGVYVPQSPRMAAQVESEASEWVNSAYAQAKALLLSHMDQLNDLAERLLESDEVVFEAVEMVSSGEPLGDDHAA
ncbi:MAG: ATP-dependent metallopeptidase FtsH/Yme1/Tma family protein [Acidithiobacillus sp.]